MLDAGHPEAWWYPLGMVWDESNMVLERQNQALIQQSILMQQVILSVIGGRSGGSALRNGIARHNVETIPYHPPEGEHEGH